MIFIFYTFLYSSNDILKIFPIRLNYLTQTLCAKFIILNFNPIVGNLNPKNIIYLINILLSKSSLSSEEPRHNSLNQYFLFIKRSYILKKLIHALPEMIIVLKTHSRFNIRDCFESLKICSIH